MLNSLGVLPLQLACQFLLTQNSSSPNFNFVVETPSPKLNTVLPSGYTVFPNIGVAYKYYKTTLAWNGARKYCIARGGNLAVIDSTEKIEYVMSLKSGNPDQHVLVGIHRHFGLDEWTDIRTGFPVLAMPFRWPTWNMNSDLPCMALWKDGSTLFPITCNEAHAYVCEIPIYQD